MRQVVIYPGEDGYWVAECSSLPGCISQGKTKEEAISNIKEAIQAYVATLADDGLPVPEDHQEQLTQMLREGCQARQAEDVKANEEWESATLAGWPR